MEIDGYTDMHEQVFTNRDIGGSKEMTAEKKKKRERER